MNDGFNISVDSAGKEDHAEYFLHLWAKSNPYKQLLSHMIDTGCCAMCYLSAASSRSILTFLMEQWHCGKEAALSFAAYLAAMHDIGKAMPWFQRQNEEQYERLKGLGMQGLFPPKYLEPIHHEYISARIFQRIWKQRKNGRRIYDPYASILSLHHQRSNKGNEAKIAASWVEIQNDLEAAVCAAFHMGDQLPCPEHMDSACILLSGLIILCDWVASSGPFDEWPEVTEDYLLDSMKIAHDTLRRYGLVSDKTVAEVHSFKALWPHIFTPRDIQKCCEELNPYAPLTVIEAPMGEGKTEAALYLAERMRDVWNKRGIYVALPTQATSNQMHGRTKAMLDTIAGGHARLLHGTAFLQYEEKHIQNDHPDDSMEAERWLESLRMGMLDENGVGTVDQAMAGVLKARFSVLRLLGLTNKVLVVDELHAYDAYMSEIIRSLLRWCKCLRIPVILLSATLQSSQRKAYLSCYTDAENSAVLSSDYPLITQVDSEGHISQHNADATMETDYCFEPVRLGEDCPAIAQYAVLQVRQGGCYCILVNTVKKAQNVYRALLEIKDADTEALLFHARFLLGRREEIEKICLRKFGRGTEASRPHKAILVATQVAEQSLDLDFDGMLTELAPIDLLLQRAGRVHRHRERTRPAGLEKPVIHVILPDDNADADLEKRYGNAGYVYAPFLLNNTEHMVENGRRIRVPSDVRTVIEEAYAQVTPENTKAWQEREFNQQLMRANADGCIFPDPQAEIFFPAEAHPEFINMDVDDGFEPAARAATRLGEPTVRIAFSNPILVEAAKRGRLTKEQQKEIFLSSVSLSMNRISYGDLENSELYKIEKGVLKGCYMSASCDKIKIGKNVLVNDPVIGVLWKE